jgi:Domain of unknown function (DUF6249)
MWHDLGTLALLIPLAGMIVPAVVIIFALERLYRIRKLDHEAKLRAIEKGYDVPMKRPSPRYPLAWPLVLTGGGLALIIVYMMTGGFDSETLGFGLAIFFIGIGLFASRFIGVKKQDEETQLHQASAGWSAPNPTAVPAVPGESTESGTSTGV